MKHVPVTTVSTSRGSATSVESGRLLFPCEFSLCFQMQFMRNYHLLFVGDAFSLTSLSLHKHTCTCTYAAHAHTHTHTPMMSEGTIVCILKIQKYSLYLSKGFESSSSTEILGWIPTALPNTMQPMETHFDCNPALNYWSDEPCLYSNSLIYPPQLMEAFTEGTYLHQPPSQ